MTSTLTCIVVDMQVSALQFIDADWDSNHVVCIGFQPSFDNTDESVAEALKIQVKTVTGLDMDVIVGTSMQDRAAKGRTHMLHPVTSPYGKYVNFRCLIECGFIVNTGVSAFLDVEEEVCKMHDGDKVGRSAIGELVRTRNRMPVNPFPEGAQLMAKAQDMATYFSYSTRHTELLNSANLCNGPTLKLQPALNGTRVAAKHTLLDSEVRMSGPLQVFANSQRPSPTWKMSEDEWSMLTEFEAVLDITRQTTTLAQYESVFTGAYGQIIKENLLRRLRADTIQVVDRENITRDRTRPPRLTIPRSEMTWEGQTCSGKYPYPGLVHFLCFIS